MSSATTTWAIPYPTGQDRFCDGDMYTEQIAERVDTLLHAYEADFDILDNIPAAKTMLTEAKMIADLNGDPLVHWDAVEYDTAGMVNIAVDNTAISFTMNAIWCVGLASDYLSTPSTANAEYEARVQITNGGNQATPAQGTRDTGTGVAAKSSFGALNIYLTHNIPGRQGKITTRLATSVATPGMFVANPGMTASWIREIGVL